MKRKYSAKKRGSRRTRKEKSKLRGHKNTRGTMIAPWIRTLVITVLSLMALNTSDATSLRQKLMAAPSKTKGKGRNHNLVLRTLNREGHTQDETNMLEWMDELRLDVMALTETKMVRHEAIYPSINTRQ